MQIETFPMNNCPFCNTLINYPVCNYIGSCDYHEVKVNFYNTIGVIEFKTDSYTLDMYQNKIMLYINGKYITINQSIKITPDSANSIVEKIKKYNAFY